MAHILVIWLYKMSEDEVRSSRDWLSSCHVVSRIYMWRSNVRTSVLQSWVALTPSLVALTDLTKNPLVPSIQVFWFSLESSIFSASLSCFLLFLTLQMLFPPSLLKCQSYLCSRPISSQRLPMDLF